VAVNISSAGAVGVHSFKRVNVNDVENFVYFKDSDIPSVISSGASYIYSDGVGQVTGVADGSLVYASKASPRVLKFLDDEDADIDFTGSVAGGVALNTPVLVDSVFNIGSSMPTNQAVKYYTSGDPIGGLVSGNTYFLKNIEATFTGVQSLYTIAGNTHTFTTCGQTGRVGPTSAQILAGYSTSWHGQNLTQGDFQGYQDWTVPVSGIYQFEARGASGHEGTGSVTRTINQTSLTSNVARIRTTVPHDLAIGMSVVIGSASNGVYNGTYTITSVPNTLEFTYARTNANIGVASSGGSVTAAVTAGRGAIVRGRVPLTKGEIITIAVGQRGENPQTGTVWGGSGGGTFVIRKTGNEPLFIAGGGAAEANVGAGRDGSLTQLGGLSTNGTLANATTPGFGGRANSGRTFGRSAGGGGFFSRGENSVFGEQGGGSFLDGLTALDNGARIGGNGGFGGGGSSDGTNTGQSGGGGGYSGGGGAKSTVQNQSGGGGGSFIIESATAVATSTGQFDGGTIFNGADIVNLNSFNTGEGSVIMTLVSSFTTGNEVYPTGQDAEDGTNQITLTPDGSSYHAFVPINFDAQNDLIHSAAPHGLVEGQSVIPTFNASAPLGISSGDIYYVNKVNNFTYRLQSLSLPSTYSTINLTVPSGRSIETLDKLSRVVVNTFTDTLTITAHGFSVDQPIQYDNGSGNEAGINDGSIAPLQHLTTYYVAEVLNANQIKLKVALDAQTTINFTAAGQGTAHSFIFITVNELSDSLYIPNHGLSSGQAVRYSNGGGTTIPGLTDNATYYIFRENASIVRLALTPALTSFANITGVGTGTQSLFITSLDYANNSISIPSHGFLQKELVLYDAKGQTVVNGLTTATPYYVIFVNGDQIKLALTPEDADAGTAIDLTASPIGEGVHSLQSLSKTPDGIYTVNTVPSPTSFTAPAAGRVPEITKTFNPRASIDLNLNAFYIPSHGFLTGTKITYDKGPDATVITGLVDDTEYYVVAINRDYIKLAETAEKAISGITLAVEDFGTGVAHKFITNQINGNITGSGSVTIVAGSVLVNGVGTSFSKILKVGDRFRLFPPNTTLVNSFASGNINTTNNRIVSVAHGFATGDTVVFRTNGGVAPSPLIDQYYYFTREVDANSYTLHPSAADAASNSNAVDISTTGTVGESGVFTFTKTTPVGPIVRRITAIGSDTQISVDRPYASAYNSVSYSFPTFVYVRPQGYSLHRPFDGGVEMSAGAGTSLAQIIRQTRKYFRYQSGKGIQTSAGINFKPSIDIESMTRVGETSTIQVRTRRPHGLISGLSIQVSEARDSFGDLSQVYNGEFQITVLDLTTFTVPANGVVVQPKAYGFPQFYVISWQNGAVRSGMMDDQNGMFYEFDGQKLYAVRRSSTQQTAGTVAALQGSELIFGTGTSFEAQFDVGDYVVMRGQSYRIVEIDSDTRMSVRPEYKGSSGAEKEFDPTEVVDIVDNMFEIIGHGFSNLLPVVYNAIDGEPIGGLRNGATYYVDLESEGTDNNAFKLKASPDAETVVSISSIGTTNVHSFTPAKSGIIVTKTVDTKIPQEDWSIDPCDGSGVTGYNLDLSKIQMIYMDYSWYGAGKIRFGFKTSDGQVQYVHEFVHNNNLFESYFRSGNLPARYEVVTFENPTYIPFLFHWGTSVMMDGRFDDDNAYLFTANSQTLNVSGTTPKSFSSAGINLTTDLFTVLEHGFRSGDILQFQSVAANGFPGPNTQNPATQVIGSNTFPNLTNGAKYKAFVNSPNLIHLTPENATITVGATIARTGSTVTVTTAAAHNIPASNNVGVYFIQTGAGADIANLPSYYVGPVTVTTTTAFTFTVSGSATVASTPIPNAAIGEILNFTSQGNIQTTYFLFPNGSLNNTSGPNYQPLLSIRLSPSVSEGLTGGLGDRDVINRMQLRLAEVGISSNELVDVKMLLNPRLNNLNFQGVDSPSLTQVVEHTASDTVSGGVQIYNFRASGGGNETTVEVGSLFELSNSILGGGSVFPDGPDIITIAVSRLTGNTTRASAKISWSEAQA
jgi:hypothetical protein